MHLFLGTAFVAHDRYFVPHLSLPAVYLPHLRRQAAEVSSFLTDENLSLPSDLDYTRIEGLSTELRQRLAKVRPPTLGALKRVEGTTPASYAVLWRFAVKGDADGAAAPSA